MIEHLRAIFVVSVVRSVIEGLGGIYVLLVAWRWGEAFDDGSWARFIPTYHSEAKALPGDRTGFVVLGLLLLIFGVLRFSQSLSAFVYKEWARRSGQILAIFDFLTPFTLPLGLWALIVYRHPDTFDHFRTHGPSAVAEATA